MKAAVWVLATWLQAGDWWSTAVGISMGIPEANPAMAWLIDFAGIWGHFFVKAACIGLLWAFAIHASRFYPRWTNGFGMGHNLLMGGVVVGNLHTISTTVIA